MKTKIVQSNSQTTSRICQLGVDAKKEEGNNNIGECAEAGNEVGSRFKISKIPR